MVAGGGNCAAGSERLVALTLGFPLGDLLLLIGISAVVMRGGLNSGSKPVALFIAGLSVFLLADASFNAIGDDGNHASGPLPATLSVLAGSICVTLAAMWQSLVVDHSSPYARSSRCVTAASTRPSTRWPASPTASASTGGSPARSAGVSRWLCC